MKEGEKRKKKKFVLELWELLSVYNLEDNTIIIDDELFEFSTLICVEGPHSFSLLVILLMS